MYMIKIARYLSYLNLVMKKGRNKSEEDFEMK